MLTCLLGLPAHLQQPLYKEPAPAPPPAPAERAAYDDEDDFEDPLSRQHDDLMDTILEEEEQLITAHRLQIEDTMDMVRREMALLTEVDQPGSAIDQYVDRLDQILR